MEGNNQYLVTKRFKARAICGNLNLPFGTKCFAVAGYICCDSGVICREDSQNGYEFFTQNDDGCGEQRRKLIDKILRLLGCSRQSKDSYDAKWDKVWGDPVCQKYKRTDYDDFWIWGYGFYHAEIPDLIYIEKLVAKG